MVIQKWFKDWNRSVAICCTGTVMKLNLFKCFFSFLLLKYRWTIFHSIHLFFLLLGLDTCTKESCIYLSRKRLFKTPNKALKFQEKPKKNTFYSNLLNFFPSVSTIGPPHGVTELIKQYRKWIFGGKMAISKIAWIKACKWMWEFGSEGV